VIGPNDCYFKDEHVVTRVIAGETIIVPIKQMVTDMKAIFTLNEMAGIVWERIDGHTRVGDLVGSIYREYRTTPEEVILDVVNLLSFFEESGLIHCSRQGCVEAVA